MEILRKLDPGCSGLHLLEEGCRLSESNLWRVQREYFQRTGIAAWSKETVPHYVTSNAAFANACAGVAFGFLRDCHVQSKDNQARLQILELGAGSGRFAYLFIKALLERWSEYSDGLPPFRYIVSDFADANVNWYRFHSGLQGFAERGVLDFARFDITQDSALCLAQTGETISPGTGTAPLMVIANYAFDSVPHDAFLVRGGRLFEGLYSLYSDDIGAQGEAAGSLERLWFDCHFSAVEYPYYSRSPWDEILQQYTNQINDGIFLFPCAALSCIDRLCALSDGRTLLLCTDKGDHRAEHVAATEDPFIELHGSVSVEVNYHAIAEFAGKAGGTSLLPAHKLPTINTAAFAFGPAPNDLRCTRIAYQRCIELFGPHDFHALKRGLRDFFPYLGVETLLSFLRLSHCDPRVFCEVVPGLRTRMTGVSADTRDEVRRLAFRSWDNYFHIGEERDIAFEIAAFLWECEFYSDSLTFFEQSLRTWGPQAVTLWNLGLCQLVLGNADAATDYFHRAFTLDPSFKPTGALQYKVGSIGE